MKRAIEVLRDLRSRGDEGRAAPAERLDARQIELAPVQGRELWVVCDPLHARVWELRRSGATLARTELEDHERARGWIAALRGGALPAELGGADPGAPGRDPAAVLAPERELFAAATEGTQ